MTDRSHNLWRKYRMTLWQYTALLESQSGGCAICGATRRGPHPVMDRCLDVDHDHFTGRIRGLLCRKCNTLIGQLDKNRELLVKIQEYLKK